MLYEVLDLGEISILEPLHEVGNGIMRDPLWSQQENWRLPVVSDLDGTLRSPDFAANVVPESGVAAQLHHSQSAALENQIYDRVVYVAHRLHFRVCQGCS